MPSTPPHRTDLMALETSILRSRNLVTVAMLASVAGYFIWFFVVKSQPLSSDSAQWGQFGDFVGGLLNPLVAYSAFYWLTNSVLLQKEELRDTREALEASASAQNRHALTAEQALRISAHTALLNSVSSEIQSLRQEGISLIEQSRHHHMGSARLINGVWAGVEVVIQEVELLHAKVNGLVAQRAEYERELKALLAVPSAT